MALAGKNGAVYFTVDKGASTRLEQVSQWSMDMKVDTVDCTNMDGNGWKEYLSTFKSWTGKIECEFDMTDSSAQAAFFNAWMNGTLLGFVLKLDATHGFTCSGIISQVGISTAVADKVKVTYEIQGSAGITYSAALS